MHFLNERLPGYEMLQKGQKFCNIPFPSFVIRKDCAKKSRKNLTWGNKNPHKLVFSYPRKQQ